MAFKSEAQKKKFQQMLKEGKITQALYDAFNNDEPVKDKKEKVVLKSLSELKNISLKKRK